MRIANLAGRLVLLTGPGAVDVEEASSGRFGPHPQSVYEVWGDFLEWCRSSTMPVAKEYQECDLGSPVPEPRQVFAIGLNYRAHVEEAHFDSPSSEPAVFTKFPTSITGPVTAVRLPPGGNTDWEVELVAVIGKRCLAAAAGDAWDYVAGLTVGQDLSERSLQLAATPPQFSLAKSYPGFGPIGPCLVTLDELSDPNDLHLRCSVNGDIMQDAKTSAMIHSVPAIIAKLSAVTPLLPGDVIFTGTPDGVGAAKSPPQYLHAGDVLVSYIQGIGQLRQTFV